MNDILHILSDKLKQAFGFDHFREYQKDVCLAAATAHDVLLVMPTGAGKSLCYQLPALAVEGARVLVITPLVALMEDQVEKLQQRGIQAERIHSGRSRQESRDACVAWRDGVLKLLFVSPERLAVDSFCEFLQKYKPTMIAVDEAHCISCWGHDFRAEYRMLGPRLAKLRPANIIALTATATPEVQKDIVSQLHMTHPKVFIHGFRRSNIAIDVISLSQGARVQACYEIIKDIKNRPAIIYAPTRKLVESIAFELSSKFKVGAFHAGIPSSDRQLIQSRFQNGEVDVMVATIAFGMGIDKSNIRTVIHTALPSSMEGYYQEIGRAGRDGAMSEAVLMYSTSDMKTHEYFFEINYPEVSVLQNIYNSLPEQGIERVTLLSQLKMEEASLNAALEKLWVHGGITVDSFDVVRPLAKGQRSNWTASYTAQRRHKQIQLNGVLRFTSKNQCRMLQFLDHFGDTHDTKTPCKICDICTNRSSEKRKIETISIADKKIQTNILVCLLDSLARTFGQLYGEVSENSKLTRRHIEDLVENLSSQGHVKTWLDSFEKDGKTLSFRWVALTDSGRVWLNQSGLAPSLAQQNKGLQKKKTAATKRRNQRARRSSTSYQARI